MSKGLSTILLLLASNTFMTIAWYGHLKFKNVGLIVAIIISWGIALLEYSLMVPANKIGSNINGGPFNMFQTETLRWNHIFGFLCLFVAVYFFFKK